jgi:DNA-directed RNA polymerase specialized sigma24 family protein
MERMASMVTAPADHQPYAQIARDQDLSVAAVKALISRARTQLRAGELERAA